MKYIKLYLKIKYILTCIKIFFVKLFYYLTNYIFTSVYYLSLIYFSNVNGLDDCVKKYIAIDKRYDNYEFILLKRKW